MTGSAQGKAANSIFANGGEMGDLMRSLDWTQTPVGSVQSWSQSLKSLVKTLLTSRYPMVLTWGAEFTQFYNDAYSQLIGDKHPAALGTDIRETLAEAWDTLGPMIQRVMATGVANWTPALPLVLERAGYREESYFSVSHAPAEDDAGQIVGMLAVCSEVTQQVLGERRLRLLRDLAAQTGETRSVQDTCQDLMSAIAAHPLDVPFALLYLREPNGRTLTLQGTVGLTVDDQLCPRSVDLATDHPLWSFASAAAGETILVEALDHQMTVPGGLWNEPVHTALMMPIASGQTTPLGVLMAGVNPNRALDEGYRSFYELLVGQVSVSIRNAQAYEEERRRAETLAELDRAKTAFFSNVSHEFRTPLTLMLNPLEEVLQSNHLPPTEREQITLAQRNAQRLLKLVNTLLDFSRIEAGRAQAHFEPTDLATYTVELISLFQSAIEQAGLRLIVDCPALPQPVSVDRDMWEKIVLNLLSNAFKFTFEGEIRVKLRWGDKGDKEDGGDRGDRGDGVKPTTSLRSSPSFVVFEVQDTGTGIPEADLPRLFERFHRVEGAQGRTFEGTGIGLSLVQELVHLHNGTIAVESTLGQGSTFRVQLPMNPPAVSTKQGSHYSGSDAQPTNSATSYVQEASGWLLADKEGEEEITPSSSLSSSSPLPSSSPLSSSSPLPSSPARIFLVDDNADMRNYLHRILSKFYQVEVFTEGAAAFNAARASTPDLVLSDVMMPGMDGFELLRQLRRDPQTREIPILLLSARAGEEAAVEGLSAGADDYLVKPFSVRELLARVAVNVELGRSRQDAAHRRLDRVLSSVSDLIYTFDLAGRFTYANQPLLDLWQKPLADIVGKNFFDLDYPPELADRLQQQIQQVITTRQPLKDETPYTGALGTRVYEYIFVPLLDGDGAVEAVAGTGRDISDRKQAEIALRESEQQFRTLTATIPQLIWTATPDGSVDYLSQQWADYIGLSPEQLYDWHWQDVVHPEDLPNTARYWRHSLETGEPVEIKHRFRFRTGEWRWQLVRGTPIKDEAGQVTKWVGTCTDIQSEINAQTALHQSEARLRTVAANLPNGAVFIVDRELRYQLAEGKALEDAGFISQDFVGKTVWEALDPNQAAIYEPYLRQALNGEPFSWEHHSHDRHYISHGVPLYNDRSEVEAVLAVSYDITERKRIEDKRKQAEAALRESEELKQRILESSKDCIKVLALDSEIVYINTGGLRLLEISNPTIVLNARWLDFWQGKDYENAKQAIEAAKSGNTGQFQGYLPTHKGTPKWWDCIITPVRNSAGQITQLVVVSRDVTKQKQEEDILRESEDRFRNMADNAPVMVWVTDPTGYCTYLSQSWYDFSGQTEETGLGFGWLNVVHPEDFEHSKNTFLSANARHEAFRLEYRLRRKNGEYRWMIDAASPWFGMDGQFKGYIGSVIDISDRKQAEAEREQLLQREQAAREQAEQANRIKDEFLAVLSHELRSPLNPILGWTRLLQNGKLDPARQMDALATIERNAKLQAQMIEDLLDISRIMQGKLTLSATPVSLAFVIAAAVETVRLAADAKHIQITLDLDPDVAPVSGDAARLQQVVWNLLTNAVKFTDNGGQVTVQLRQVAAADSLDHAMAQIRVIDTGKGISRQFLSHVFEYFRQEDGSTTRKFGGLGLGLAIVRQIVELHGGTVKAESKGEQQGATFIVQLPTLQASLIDLKPTQAQANSEMRLQNVQILLVDDDTDTREFEAFLLKQQGATVTVAASSKEALQALDRSLPDVIVSDIGMAEIDGYMLMQQIRSRPPAQGGTVPAIALTAYAAEIDQKKALQSGYQMHLTKPLEPEQFVSAIVTLLNSNRV